MPFSATRMMVYALLSAIEEDLRRRITEAAAGSPVVVLGDGVVESAQKRFENELGVTDEDLTLEELLPYTDLGDLFQCMNKLTAGGQDTKASQYRNHRKAIEQVLPVRKRIAHVRPLDYEDFARVDSITSLLAAEDSVAWSEIADIRARMDADPAFVFSIPQPAFEEPPSRVFYRLPLPDYDDTGFLGRNEEVKHLLRLLNGPWPVVSIVGEGGLGKSALALKAAYELLARDESCPFDAIVFSTSKNAQLTPTQIRKLSVDVQDSLGLLGEAAQTLGGDRSNAIDDLLLMMSGYRVLLILDNLENVLDQTIRDFLDELPNGSKVLVTSRIGLGDYEKRVPLGPMSSSDATALLRTFARVSNVQHLQGADHERLASLCRRMQHNPLFIKWFVSSVQAGSNPESVLGSPGLFLDYCLSNVYSYLSSGARHVLALLQLSPDELNLAELAFLNDDELDATEASLQELLVTNMVSMNVRQQGAVCDAAYQLSEMARMYLSRHHPVADSLERALRAREREMADLRRQTMRKVGGSSYSTRSLDLRSPADALVAKHLRDAQIATEAGQLGEAYDALTRAKSLAPDWYECYRVEAQTRVAANDIAAASVAFDTAIEMAPRSNSLRVFYADFLSEFRGDPEGAIEQVDAVLAAGEREVEVLQRHIRLSLSLLAFDAARQSALDLQADPRRHGSLDAESLRLIALCELSEALFATETGDFERAALCLDRLRSIVDGSPGRNRRPLREVIDRSAGVAYACNSRGGETISARAASYIQWLATVGMSEHRLEYGAWAISDHREFGEVKLTIPEKGYGFITAILAHPMRFHDGGDWWFHRSGLQRTSDWDLLRPGSSVSFVPGANSSGGCGVEVRIET